ncbi:helix-turn-helix domain-containing protein [Lelliottia sp. RWM.1]|uniref:helix-turn-helix domain-containing protein n=1 Tax=Lelliottia sp. RWM.1 TaxID=2663242 RepID=UPI00193D4C81|nr:helix-turn-helix domain-containing protein [Lelliottia sp. RWM.1]MBM3074678.1 hypothetical protein [Lelliottia sp. RWM.1]
MDNISIEKSIAALGSAIINSEKSVLLTYEKNQRINTHNTDVIYYVAKGNVSIHPEDHHGLLLFNIFAPEIIGLEKIRGVNIMGHLRCHTDVDIYTLKTDDAISLFDEQNLWPNAYDGLLRYLNSLSRRESRLNQPKISHIIIEHIKYIWTLRPAQRERTSIFSYILQRSNISRSAVHKTVAELEKKGLILVQRGILIECHLGAPD